MFKEDRYEIKAEVFKDDKGWASLVVQTIKNLSAMHETWVRSLGQEDPLEKGIATHSSILAWRISWTEKPVHGVAKSQT